MAKFYKNIAVIRDASGKANCPAETTPCTSAAVTECVSPEKHSTDCPITDVKLVEASSFDPNDHPGYTAAADPESKSLSWKLLFSRTANYLPLANF